MGIAIKVDKLSKRYRLGQFDSNALKRDFVRNIKSLAGKNNSSKLADTNDRTVVGNSEFVWSIRDVSFEIEQGSAIGIIGRNGAGKSTLLKLLSRVTSPTTGEIYQKGRVASLLEVGTGFHPELTGKENIFLNGAILGMRKSEIKSQFDAIVDFAGIAKYVDTPVKRYSSGMYVRLGFAVAAHLRSEILIVDEVLAVGDAEFQKKCLGKMNDISSAQGRTILFVSHNMESVLGLCDSSILLSQGSIETIGKTSDVISTYLGGKDAKDSSKFNLAQFNESSSYNHDIILFKRLTFIGGEDNSNIFCWDDYINFEIEFEVKTDVKQLFVGITIANQAGVNIGTANNDGNELKLSEGTNVIKFGIKNSLRHGKYNIHLGAKEKGVNIWWHTEVANYIISKKSALGIEYPEHNAGLIQLSSTITSD